MLFSWKTRDGDDKSENFYHLCLLWAKDDPALMKWVEKTYDRDMTPKDQNDMLRILVLSLLPKIADDIRSSGCFSLLAMKRLTSATSHSLLFVYGG